MCSQLQELVQSKGSLHQSLMAVKQAFGRDEEIRKVVEMLDQLMAKWKKSSGMGAGSDRSGATRAVMIWGGPGEGKKLVAARTALELHKESLFPGGAYCCSMEGVTSADNIKDKYVLART